MFKRTTSFIVFILFIIVGGAQAQITLTYSSGGKHYFNMSIPDEWRVNVGSEKDISSNSEGGMKPVRLISAMPNSGVPLWFAMWVPHDLEKIDGALEYMTSLGLDLLADVVITDSKNDILNSMKVQYVRGTGSKNGEVMDFRTGFFQLSPEHVAIAIYIGPPETTISHGEDLVQMIESLQPLVK